MIREWLIPLEKFKGIFPVSGYDRICSAYLVWSGIVVAVFPDLEHGKNSCPGITADGFGQRSASGDKTNPLKKPISANQCDQQRGWHGDQATVPVTSAEPETDRGKTAGDYR